MDEEAGVGFDLDNGAESGWEDVFDAGLEDVAHDAGDAEGAVHVDVDGDGVGGLVGGEDGEGDGEAAEEGDAGVDVEVEPEAAIDDGGEAGVDLGGTELLDEFVGISGSEGEGTGGGGGRGCGLIGRDILAWVTFWFETGDVSGTLLGVLRERQAQPTSGRFAVR